MKPGRDEVEIWLDASFMSKMEKVGILYHDRGSFSFAYDGDWLRGPNKFNIDPALGLYSNEQHCADTFGIFTDSAPDRWGRVLMDRRELINAKNEGRAVRALREFDYLLGVQDETRMGALRLRKNGAFVDNSDLSAPPVTSVPELQEIARNLERFDDESSSASRWLLMLLAPGSALGGARPKANFSESDGSLWIAKFPKQDDKEDIGLWEGITMELAGMSGIKIPEYRIDKISGDHHTFFVKRFDRNGDKREMFVSAMTMLEKKDGEPASYLEIAEFIQNNGGEATIQNEMRELWRRMVFNVMVSNRDDHLRNHGFLRDAQGWRLSPAYDMNPNKAKATHSINLNYNSSEPSLDGLFEGVDFLRISWGEAAKITTEVYNALSKWRDVAKRAGARSSSIDLMSPAFAMVSESLNLPKKPIEKKTRTKSV